MADLHKAQDPAGSWFTVAPSINRTATDWWDFDTAYDGSPNAQSLFVIIDCTVDAEAASVVFKIQGVDPISGKTWDILTSAAVAAVGTVVLRVSPHITAAANTIAKDIVPARVRILATAADGDDLTYSIGAQLVA
jgi:hypothetical protein